MDLSSSECDVISLNFCCCSVKRSEFFFICLSCVFDSVLWIVWWNNSEYVWVWLLFCCWMLWKYLVCVDVLCWIDRACCACDPSMHLSVPSIGFVFVCRKLSPHLIVWELDNRCLLSLCCFFVWFCILCGQVTGKSLQLLCILPFGMLCVSAISMMFVKIL